LWNIFISRRDGGVALARCCNCPFGGATRTDSVVDVTEYEHTPQAGFGNALVGTFVPKLNPDYDANKRGSARYIRCYDLKVSDILVFNVKMSGKSGTDLQVKTESLT